MTASAQCQLCKVQIQVDPQGLGGCKVEAKVLLKMIQTESNKRVLVVNTTRWLVVTEIV